MAKMQQGNKVVDVDERSINYYLKEGYDHVEFDAESKSYKVVQAGKHKSVPYEEYLKVVVENEQLKTELAKAKAVSKK